MSVHVHLHDIITKHRKFDYLSITCICELNSRFLHLLFLTLTMYNMDVLTRVSEEVTMLQGQTNMYMYVDLNACGRKHNVLYVHVHVYNFTWYDFKYICSCKTLTVIIL